MWGKPIDICFQHRLQTKNHKRITIVSFIHNFQFQVREVSTGWSIIPKLGSLSGLEPDLSLSSFKPCIRIQQDVESCFIEVWEWLSNRNFRLPRIIKLETRDRDHLATPMLVLDEMLCWCCMARLTIGRVKLKGVSDNLVASNSSC